MNIMRHYEREEGESGITSIEFVGGSMDGEILRTVRAVLEDGSETIAWVSNARPGYFKQCFVPWNHPIQSGHGKLLFC